MKVEELEAMLRGTVEFLFDPKSAWKARGMRDVEDAVRGGVDEDEVSLAGISVTCRDKAKKKFGCCVSTGRRLSARPGGSDTSSAGHD